MDKDVDYRRLFQQLSPLYGRAKDSDTLWADNLSIGATDWRKVIAALQEFQHSLIALRNSSTPERPVRIDDELGCVASLINQLATANRLGSFEPRVCLRQVHSTRELR